MAININSKIYASPIPFSFSPLFCIFHLIIFVNVFLALVVATISKISNCRKIFP